MKIIEKYSEFLANHPFIIIFIVLLLCILSVYFASSIKNGSMNYKNMLPDNIETMKAFDILENSFGGSDSAMISIELDTQYIDSNEPEDIRDPNVISYINILSEMIRNIDDVTGVSSASTVLKQANGNILPRSRSDIINITANNALMSQYISSDYTLSVIKINLADNYDENSVADDLKEIIDQVKSPPGLDVNVAGESMTSPIVNAQMGPDMAKTSNFSLIAILVILMILLRSIKYAISPLITIGIGILLAFGYIGLIGMNMTPATSGVISMIMGIGIDFGIQTVTRFRQELRKSNAKQAIMTTMNNVFIPMFTTTLAALIGFRAMTMGQLTLMADLGNIMTYGVAACFIAAVTILPAILILGERIKFKNIKKILAR